MLLDEADDGGDRARWRSLFTACMARFATRRAVVEALTVTYGLVHMCETVFEYGVELWELPCVYLQFGYETIGSMDDDSIVLPAVVAWRDAGAFRERPLSGLAYFVSLRPLVAKPRIELDPDPRKITSLSVTRAEKAIAETRRCVRRVNRGHTGTTPPLPPGLPLHELESCE